MAWGEWGIRSEQSLLWQNFTNILGLVSMKRKNLLRKLIYLAGKTTSNFTSHVLYCQEEYSQACSLGRQFPPYEDVQDPVLSDRRRIDIFPPGSQALLPCCRCETSNLLLP